LSASLEKHLGLSSGIGLVVANMIGAGVFLSTGFMSQDLPPAHILLAWVVGCVLALCGARAYAEVAARVPGSGGEYRYVSTLLHPALGSLAGWASLLVGFSAPIAVDALAAGLFAHAVAPGLPPTAVAVGLIVGLTALHALRLDLSRNAQGALVVLKLLLVFGFIAVGLTAGSLAWPTWNPPAGAPASFPLAPFMSSLFFIAFAFSGWNAAVYAAGEFKDAARDVPRAMLIGCAGVGALYLVMNYLFVANITPAEGTIVFKYGSEPVTLGHAVMKRWAGEGAAGAMSAIVVLLFISAMSAMILLGPRVYAAMAKDGYLPQALAEKQGKPPTLAVLLQGALALALVFIQSIKETLGNVGAVLVLFSALTVAGLFKPGLKDVPLVARAAAGVYVLSSAWMLYFGVTRNPMQYLWVLGAAALGFGFYALKKRQPA
jgi:basic amino acid/polyamine antiporter, APA family